MNIYIAATENDLGADPGVFLFRLGRLLNKTPHSLADLNMLKGALASVLLAHSVVVALVHAVGGTVAADEESL